MLDTPTQLFFKSMSLTSASVSLSAKKWKRFVNVFSYKEEYISFYLSSGLSQVSATILPGVSAL